MPWSFVHLLVGTGGNASDILAMPISNFGREMVSLGDLCVCVCVCSLVLGVCRHSIARAERDGTRAETRFRLSPKRTSPFKSVGASVQSTAGSRGVRISFRNAGYTTFRGGVRVLATHSIRQFPLHFPSRASPCATRFQTSSTSGWVITASFPLDLLARQHFSDNPQINK